MFFTFAVATAAAAAGCWSPKSLAALDLGILNPGSGRWKMKKKMYHGAQSKVRNTEEYIHTHIYSNQGTNKQTKASIQTSTQQNKTNKKTR